MSRRKTFDEFINESVRLFGHKYSFPDGVYIDSVTKIRVHCCVCENTYLQKPIQHISGTGCPTCGRKQANKKTTKPFSSFIDNAAKIHGWKYEYIESYYTNRRSVLPIYCLECDSIFYQKAYEHLNGHGCKGCSKHAVDFNKIGSVYKIVCHKNKAAYVGITTTSLKQRLRRHFEASKFKYSKSPLHDLMAAYAKEDFTIHLLEQGRASSLGLLEERWINSLGTQYPAGLNKAKGGYGLLIKNKRHSGQRYEALIREISMMQTKISEFDGHTSADVLERLKQL